MHLNLNPLDIAFLRSVDHVVADIASEERCLRAENYALADKLAQAEVALAMERRTARLLLGVVVALLVACGWLGYTDGRDRAMSDGWTEAR